ncbi:MAG TPA: hypothetical protein VLF19_00750 [Methylomirabilota bacterium]|nr:hypothetical protein [Methylomirabilota bacterium]
MSAGPPREIAVYRPFALLAFAATVLVGTPLGVRMLAWLYLGASAVTVDTVLLHAHLQTVGFFGTLIPGVAHHLVARFTGRPTRPTRATPWMAALLGTAGVLRIACTWSAPAGLLVAALLETAAFTVFGAWILRSLAPPPLTTVRRHLAAATAWLGVACLAEAALRGSALAGGVPTPDLGGMRAAHAMAIYGGAIGWVLGVLLRAGPMFVEGWRVPGLLATTLPGLLAAAVMVTAAGEIAAVPAIARAGEALALGAVVAVALAAGALRPAPRALPMLSRSAPEARIFRLGVVSAAFALCGAVGAAALAAAGAGVHVLTDAVRHLVTVGFLTSVVVAMAFRLIPTLEATSLPWPGLRVVAFWSLLGATVLRTTQVAVAHGWPVLAPIVPVSGLLAWVALAGVGATLLGTLHRVASRR